MPVSVIAGSATFTELVFWGTVTLLIGLSVGGWLTCVTMTLKLREKLTAGLPLSVTVTLIVAVPKSLAVGVKLSVPVALGLV